MELYVVKWEVFKCHLVETMSSKWSDGGEMSTLFCKWNLPKATVSIQLAEYPGTRKLGKDVIHFQEWVHYAEYASIERFQINTDSDHSIILQHTTLPAHHSMGASTLEMTPRVSMCLNTFWTLL